MSIIRKRSAANKAFIPSNARDNQYIMAEFNLTNTLLDKISPHWREKDNEPYTELYKKLSSHFFDLCEQCKLDNGLFIANDKLPLVRYSNEMHQWQTNQQVLFYYNPNLHTLKKSFYDGGVRAQKICFLFLSSGYDIRLNSAKFHQKINNLLQQFLKEIDLQTLCVRLSDHQHLTYDLFSEQKGSKKSITHKLRQVKNRYASENVIIPDNPQEMTYAIITIPITNNILNLAEIDLYSNDPYNPLYAMITDAFTLSCKHYNLNNGTLIANGLVPIIRYSNDENIHKDGELQRLGFNPDKGQCGIVSKWDANELVEHAKVIFVANHRNKKDATYARFLNQIEQAMRLMATELELSPKKDEVTVRFHQHIAYDL